MQALHRIYRIGSNRKKTCNWFVYISKHKDGSNTVETRIDDVLRLRLDRLYELLDDEFILQPLSLDTSDETDGNSFYGKKDNEDDILQKISGV